jgi:hypothetical protein
MTGTRGMPTLSRTPLPYLTAIIKPRITDHRTVSAHIFGPVMQVAIAAAHNATFGASEAEQVKSRAASGESGRKQARVRRGHLVQHRRSRC